jgi:hypothetical protein
MSESYLYQLRCVYFGKHTESERGENAILPFSKASSQLDSVTKGRVDCDWANSVSQSKPGSFGVQASFDAMGERISVGREVEPGKRVFVEWRVWMGRELLVAEQLVELTCRLCLCREAEALRRKG